MDVASIGPIRLIGIHFRVLHSFFRRRLEFLINIVLGLAVHLHVFGIKCSLCHSLMRLCLRTTVIWNGAGLVLRFNRIFQDIK